MRDIKSISLKIFNIKLKLKRNTKHNFGISLVGISPQHPLQFRVTSGICLAEIY